MSDQKLPVVRTGQAGRPPYSDAVRAAILKSLKIGNTRPAAYGAAGVHESTFYAWMHDIPGFAEAVAEAEAKAESLYVGRIARAAAAGDVGAAKFWLERRRAKTWRERMTIETADPSLEDLLDEAGEDDDLRRRLADLASEAQRRGATATDAAPDPGGSNAASPDAPAGGA
jgi:hypothetical protein